MVTTPPVCGHCACSPGWAGPGSLCGKDEDSDGVSDEKLGCDNTAPACRLVLSRIIPTIRIFHFSKDMIEVSNIQTMQKVIFGIQRTE